MTRERRIGAIAIALVAAVTLLLFTGIYRIPFEGGTRTVTADFERAAQLHTGDEVRLEGNIEGSVKSVEPAPAGEQARVELEVNTDAGPLYADASARIRELTLLGGTFIVDIDRGTKSQGLLDDAVIPADNTSVQVEIDDLTDIAREGAFTGLQTLPTELGEALADPRAPSDAIANTDAAASDVTVATEAARGLLPGKDLPELIVNGATTAAALQSGNDDLRTLVSGAAATVQTTGNRNAEIRETIAAAPSVAYDLDQTLGRLDSTLALTDGLIGRLEEGVPAVAPALTALRPALAELDQLNPKLPFLLTTADGTLDGLRDSERLGAALGEFRPTLAKLVQNMRDLNRVDPVTEKPTSVMIGGTAAGFGGVASIQDAAGHFVRFPASIGASSIYLPCQSNIISPDAPSALACDEATTILQSYFGYFPGGDDLLSTLGLPTKKKGGR